jgi:glutathione S-transferase
MIDGEVKLSRPIAICKYLIQCNKKDTKFYPLNDLKLRTRIDGYLDYEVMDLRGAAIACVNQKRDPDSTVETAEEVKDGMKGGIFLLNIMVGKAEGKFFFGDEPSLADFAVFSTIYEVSCHGGFRLNEHPEIEKWYNCVADVPAINACLDQFK